MCTVLDLLRNQSYYECPCITCAKQKCPSSCFARRSSECAGGSNSGTLPFSACWQVAVAFQEGVGGTHLAQCIHRWGALA